MAGHLARIKPALPSVQAKGLAEAGAIIEKAAADFANVSATSLQITCQGSREPKSSCLGIGHRIKNWDLIYASNLLQMP